MSALADRNPGQFVWSPGAAPISIQLGLDLVERLQPAAQISDTRTPEVGGVLLGRTRQNGQVTVVSVEDFVLVDCEHSRSESWSLSARDRYIFESTLRQIARRRKGSPVAVGWFRTHTRRGLYLDQYDFNIFREYFSGPSSVALLIRPENPAPTAGFFFWERGELQRSRPHDTFPFSADLLRPRAVTPSPVSPVVAPVAEPPRVSVPRPAPKLVPELPVAAKPQPTRTGFRLPAIPAVNWQRLRIPPLQPVNWRKAAFILPVLAGVAFGIFWNPSPLQTGRRSDLSRNREREPQERAVFTPAPLPPENDDSVFTPPPEQGAEQPKAPAAPPPKVVRTLQVPRPQVKTREPVLDVQPPAIAAVARFDALPPAKVQHLPRAVVTVEPYRPSVLRRAVGSIPGLGFLKRKKQAASDEYVPARVLAEYRPVSPAQLTQEVAVNVKLTVSSSGDVERAELLSKRVDLAIAQAAMDAARRWRFQPARLDEKPVSSEMLLQFRFGAADSDGT